MSLSTNFEHDTPVHLRTLGREDGLVAQLDRAMVARGVMAHRAPTFDESFSRADAGDTRV